MTEIHASSCFLHSPILDNGPEFIAEAIRAWLTRAGVGTLYVERGAPWENGYAEAFQSRLRDEFLNAESFANLREAQALARVWKREYNEERPHSSLGYLTPHEFPARQPDLPLGATLLAPGQALQEHENWTLIAAGTQKGGHQPRSISATPEVTGPGDGGRHRRGIRVVHFPGRQTGGWV